MRLSGLVVAVALLLVAGIGGAKSFKKFGGWEGECELAVWEGIDSGGYTASPGAPMTTTSASWVAVVSDPNWIWGTTDTVEFKRVDNNQGTARFRVTEAHSNLGDPSMIFFEHVWLRDTTVPLTSADAVSKLTRVSETNSNFFEFSETIGEFDIAPGESIGLNAFSAVTSTNTLRGQYVRIEQVSNCEGK